MKNITFLFLFFILSFSIAQTTRFMVFGDTHHFSPSANFKETVFYELVCAAIDERVDFVFIAGDLVIRNYAEAADKDSVFRDWYFVMDTLKQHNIKFYAARGNNDYSRAAWDSLFSGNYAFPVNGPENEKNVTYTIELNNVLFIVLDQFTQSLKINQKWLDEILSHTDKIHIFAAGHEPAFKVYNSTNLGVHPAARDSLWESLLMAGSKIFFSGHDHFYDHALIDDGDENPANDMHQMIVGTANYLFSDSDYNGDNGRWTPVRIFHEQSNGYLLVEVTGSSVQSTWKQRSESGIYINGEDNFNYSVTALDGENAPYFNFVLQQNYPNPFNNSTMINYQLAATSDVNLSVYNILGQKVATQVNKNQTAGNYNIEWDASGFASGIYIYTLETSTGFKQSRKLLLLK